VHAFPENSNIAVIGGAQSALEYALEADVRGNNVTLYVRDQLMYRNLHEPNQLIYRFLATNCEKIIGWLPVRLKTRLLAYLLEGTCEPQVSEEVANSDINVKENVEIGACYQINDQVVSVVSSDGERQFDRVIAATGYHYDMHRINYLSSWLNESKHVIEGRFPNLDDNVMLRNAPPGMYFTGYSCIYAIGFKAQFINGSNIIVKRIINDIKRRL
jgi:cation diffusion facilitator CzcD-associated flavoprotein CzcO